MKIFVKQNKLNKALNIVSRAAATRSTNPALEGILIKTNNNQINLYATDSQIQISTVVDAKVLMEGSVLVPAKIFTEIIKNLPDEDIEITVNENLNISIICNKISFDIPGMDDKQFPAYEVYNTEDFVKIKNETLKSMIKETIFSCAGLDSVNPILTGVLVECNNNDFRLVAIDGYRMAIRTELIEYDFSDKISCIVPSKTLNEILKIISSYEDDVYINVTDKKFILNVNKTQIVSNLLQGVFINYNDIMPKETGVIVKINTIDFLRSCERASIITEEGKNNLVKMEFKEDILKISSNTSYQNFEDELNVKKSGNDLEIAFNSKYFIDALRNINETTIILEFNNKNTPCVIKAVDSNNFTYLIMPVRLS